MPLSDRLAELADIGAAHMLILTGTNQAFPAGGLTREQLLHVLHKPRDEITADDATYVHRYRIQYPFDWCKIHYDLEREQCAVVKNVKSERK